MQRRWQFWIDVGGTFTDCVGVSPDGQMRTCKTLSSGVVKGQVADIQGRTFRDPRRIGDPPQFWIDWECSLVDANGSKQWTATVVNFDAMTGELNLAAGLPAAVSPGMQYELSSDIEAPVICMRMLLGRPLSDPLPPLDLRMGTTRGTNALLERKGARTAFVTTAGFGDLLLIGNQDRPDLFALNIQKPRPLYETVIEVEERLDASGDVIRPLDETTVREELARLKDTGITSVAIALLHAYRNPDYEARIEAIARELGFDEVSRSSLVSPTIKIVPRAETTVIDAYLTPVLRNYLRRIQDQLHPESTMKLMTSHGGLVDASAFTGKDSLLSGPAGGVVAVAKIGQQAGFVQSIGFDMGGTSTDVSRFGGAFEVQTETVKAGVRIASPTLAIETVAAGGGSICRFDGVQLHVGPESAGADPGPACYGRGGPLTVTDMNVALGRVLSEDFPFPLDRSAVTRQLEKLCQEIRDAWGTNYTPSKLAQGFVEIANETMARAIRTVSVQRGFHPRDHVLISFGGAGGLHACAIAKSLGTRQILVHPFAGILSAYGMGLADIRKRADQTVLKALSSATLSQLEDVFTDLERKVRCELSREGIPEERISAAHRTLNLRYQGVEATIPVPLSSDRDLRETYEELHEQFYGYRRPDRPVEIVTVSVEVIGHIASALSEAVSPAQVVDAGENRYTDVWHASERLRTPVFKRQQISPGTVITGPAIVSDAGATLWIDPDFTAGLQTDGTILLTAKLKSREVNQEIDSTQADPIQLEVFNNQFASIAEQMGETLRKTSISTNVKERLDYSCALFDAEGGLVVNAPHIPVHLGAMGETVRAVLNEFPELNPGDVIVTNDPFAGGSHLPDVTVITPVHDALGRLIFLTASRAHHAEIGGITPGSMPPFSRTLAEEGVLIRPFKLVDAGTSNEDKLSQLLTSGAFPSRNPSDNLADIAAQVAANKTGAQRLLLMIKECGQEVVLNYMKHIQRAASQKIRQALSKMTDGTYSKTDFLDDGSPISVRIEIQGETARIDFTGTGPVLSTNLNANRAIVTSACLYVFRCLIAESIPLNQGVLEPLKIILPECLLNPPRHANAEDCVAMVGGNVETSQRVVDVLLGALEMAAASQGTMNNLTFGNEKFGYYETICGGAGATTSASGADAVHTHMTNTRLTDVEVIEFRYPVRVKEFRVRKGSGGIGLHHGGDGIVRTFEFLEPLKISILSQRRGTYPPFGLNGGESGQTGRNLLIQKCDQQQIDLGAAAHFEAHPGDQLTIATPGGGGYGQAATESTQEVP